MIDFSKVFETKDILLRPMRTEDYDGFSQLTTDQDLWVHFTSDLSDLRALRRWVETSVREMKNKKRLALTIIDKPSGLPVGSTSIGNIAERDKRVEIGWTWLGRDFQGKGINDQCKYLLLTYCFEELGCLRVEFKTDVLNHPARKALKRIGAMEEGVLRSHTLMTHNRRRDTIYYSILQSEWKRIKQKNNRAL
jgi:RimJ/RimL family protein N-acetyltransferase